MANWMQCCFPPTPKSGLNSWKFWPLTRSGGGWVSLSGPTTVIRIFCLGFSSDLYIYIFLLLCLFAHVSRWAVPFLQRSRLLHLPKGYIRQGGSSQSSGGAQCSGESRHAYSKDILHSISPLHSSCANWISSKEGLRTLCVAYRPLSPAQYQEVCLLLSRAKLALQDRDKRLAEAYDIIEKDLILLGATAVEDR